MKTPLRIAILECDRPLEKTTKQFGSYGGVFRQMLERAAERSGMSKDDLDIKYFAVENGSEFPKLEEIDAILLTGSRYNSFDNDQWILDSVEYTKKALADESTRVIGVCFGHQIVGRALGAPVGRSDKGWEVSVTPVKLTELGKNVLGMDKLDIFQMHQDIVTGFPEGAEPLGSSPKCENQGMYKKDRYITVQGHPEFTHDIVEEILKSRQAMGIFPDGIFDDGMRRLRDHDDGVAVAQGFLKFLLA